MPEALKTFDVHVYPICRVLVTNIQAKDHQEAIEKAFEQLNKKGQTLHDIYPEKLPVDWGNRRSGVRVYDGGWVEGDDGCMVDEIDPATGDRIETESKYFNAKGEPEWHVGLDKPESISGAGNEPETPA